MTRNERLRFEHTALRLRAELRRAAERMAGHAHADDLVQETLLRAFVAWTRVDPQLNARAWLHTILRNTFINQYRRLQREAPLLEEPQDRDHSMDRIHSLDLRRAVSELPAPLRSALVSVDIEGLAYREAAEREGTPVGTIMSRLHRARERVAQRLAA
jgi:RNA polymerase sigma-70 factor (ECF subfamily)